MRTDCCGAKVAAGPDDGGAVQAYCRDCEEEVCSSCAGSWDVDGGYGDDGSGIRITAKCNACKRATLPLQQT